MQRALSGEGRQRTLPPSPPSPQLWQYIAGGYSWDAVFLSERTPWAEGMSLDNVYSGLLVHLCRLAGGDAPARGSAPTPSRPASARSRFPCDDAGLSALDCTGAFLRRWFRVAMPLLLRPALCRCPASKADVATARDNFVLAASIAAGRDLSAHFSAELRWPVGAAIAPAAGGGGGLVAQCVAEALPWPEVPDPAS